MLDRQLENPPCRVSPNQARVRQLWIEGPPPHPIIWIHYPHSLALSLTMYTRPHTPSIARQRTRRQTAPGPLLPKYPSHVWGKGNIRCGPGRPWAFSYLSPWMSTSHVHPHHSMAQPLCFSNSGRYRLGTSSLSVAGWPAAV